MKDKYLLNAWSQSENVPQHAKLLTTRFALQAWLFNDPELLSIMKLEAIIIC